MSFEDQVSTDGLPASIHTEVAILGAMLLDGVALSDATLKLVAEDFSLDSHQRIYRAILTLLERGTAIDITTVRTELERRRDLDAVGGPAYLFHLTEGIPRNLSIEAYVRIVKDKSLLRQVMGICHNGSLRAADQSEDGITVLADVEEALSSLSRESVISGFVTAADIVNSAPSVDQLLAGGTEEGDIATGFAFDRWTNKLKGGQLVVIGGRPSMGKTGWALNAAAYAALEEGKVVGIITLEMSREEVLRRIIQSASRVSLRSFASKTISAEHRKRVYDTMERVINAQIHIDDKAFTTMPEIRAKARRLHHQHNLDLLVLDYIGLVEGTGKKQENRVQEVSAVSRGLKALAKELKIPVIALAQLNRKCEERPNKRPMLSDLRDSGSIEQDADIVAFVYREEMYQPDNPDVRGKAEFIVAKQRDGQIGTMHMVYLNHITLFEDAALPHQEAYAH
jgi:replicative DNA helicase